MAKHTSGLRSIVSPTSGYIWGIYAEAEALFKRSLAIDEKALGPDHPDVAQRLKNLAGLRRSPVRMICFLYLVHCF